MPLQTIWQAIAGRLLKNLGSTVDGQQLTVATDAYGRLVAQLVSASDHGAADEGSYYVSSTGVAGTAVADQTTNSPNTAVPSDVAPAFLCMNTNAAGGPNIWLKRIHRVMIAPGTASQTGVDVQGQLDLGLQYTSGGTKLTTVNQNPLGKPSGAVMYVGAIVKPAKTVNAVIYCARSKPRSTIAIAGDEYNFKFGASDGPTSFISSSTGATRQVIDVGPIIIPPGWTFSLHFAYGLTVTGSPTSDWEVGHIER